MSEAPFKLDIDPEAVNQMISKAVLESAIGPQIQDAVDKHIKSFGKTWDFKRHIEEVVRKEISNEIQRVIGENKVQIRTFVESQMTDELLQKTLQTMWERWERRY